MTTTFVVLITVIVLTAGIFALVRYYQERGSRVITCPDNHELAGVEVDAAHAALTSIFRGTSKLQLSSCTRWPEKAGCDQACLREVVDSPNHCLVRTILADWYLGRNCVYCAKPIGEVNWHDHRPALYDSEQRKTVEWVDVRPELVYSVLATHEPVCWNCHVAESFRREHPDLVTDRPDHRATGS